MPTITMPSYPDLGIPSGMKDTGQRADFKEKSFDLLIETKGYLLLWQRATVCPCSPVTSQTTNPDPNCSLCNGKGWIYFSSPTTQDLSGYIFTDLQQSMIDTTGGMVIRGVMTGLTKKDEPYREATSWVGGMANLTVRSNNRLGYYDRLTSLDSEIVFAEIITADGTANLSTRYPVINVNHLRSVTTVYAIGSDFYVEAGQIVFYPGKEPAANARLSVHYLCHPTWLVVEWPHAARVTNTKYKSASPITPTGDAKQLPIQAVVQYEFLQE